MRLNTDSTERVNVNDNRAMLYYQKAIWLISGDRPW